MKASFSFLSDGDNFINIFYNIFFALLNLMSEKTKTKFVVVFISPQLLFSNVGFLNLTKFSSMSQFL